MGSAFTIPSNPFQPLFGVKDVDVLIIQKDLSSRMIDDNTNHDDRPVT
jgi:hypothetical protein